MKSSRRPPPLVRTTHETGFSLILERLVEQVGGCHAAAFVDDEGEAIDIAGRGTHFDICVVGAHMRILLDESRLAGLGPVRQIAINGLDRSFVARTLLENCALTLLLAPRAALAVSSRAIDVASFALEREAGFRSNDENPAWFPIDVAPTTRPTKARTVPVRPVSRSQMPPWRELEIIGQLVGLRRGERGYRVRLENGMELMLVREPLGAWWADELL
jgi:hypothetical protein